MHTMHPAFSRAVPAPWRAFGDTPGIGTTLAYVIATQGVAGLAFGVLRARTRRFALVVALHGLFDACSNAASFVDTWGL